MNYRIFGVLAVPLILAILLSGCLHRPTRVAVEPSSEHVSVVVPVQPTAPSVIVTPEPSYGYVEPSDEAKVVRPKETVSGWAPGSAYNRMFNLSTMTTISGTVQSISTFEPLGGGAPGVRLRVSTPSRIYTVDAGPQSFLNGQDMTFVFGDIVTVTGSMVTIDGQPVLMASQIVKGDKTVRFRDTTGYPLWWSATSVHP